jgi:hypothetical protein
MWFVELLKLLLPILAAVGIGIASAVFGQLVLTSTRPFVRRAATEHLLAGRRAGRRRGDR